MKLLHRFPFPLAYAALAACQAQDAGREQAKIDVGPAEHAQTDSASASNEAATPTLEYVGTELRAYGYDDDPYYRFMDIIRFSNPTPVAWEFWGESVTWPLWSRLCQMESGEWEIDPRFICGTGLGKHRIEAGQVAEFPAHSARSIIPDEPVRFSVVQLEMTNVVTGEKVTVCTEGYLPEIKAEDGAFRATLDRFGEPIKPRSQR